MKWAHELRNTIIKECGLPISFGLSVNKTVSKIATGEAKPNGEKEVPQYGVQPFLDLLSIRKIPMIGAKTYYLLRSMGSCPEMRSDQIHQGWHSPGTGYLLLDEQRQHATRLVG